LGHAVPKIENLNFNHFVVEDNLSKNGFLPVKDKQFVTGFYNTGETCPFLSLGSHEIVRHPGVVGEHRGGSTNLSTHVANCAHS
jgi:hypothetical protein